MRRKSRASPALCLKANLCTRSVARESELRASNARASRLMDNKRNKAGVDIRMLFYSRLVSVLKDITQGRKRGPALAQTMARVEGGKVMVGSKERTG